MKNLIKISMAFLAAVMILASCNKDQKCVNWLEGDWSITGLEMTDSNGTTVDAFAQAASFGLTMNGTMTFSKYKVKKEEMGTSEMYIHVTGHVFGQPVDEKDTTNYNYKIQDDCETAWLQEVGSSESSSSTIEEASKKKMIFSDYDETEKSTTRITIEKK